MLVVSAKYDIVFSSLLFLLFLYLVSRFAVAANFCFSLYNISVRSFSFWCFAIILSTAIAIFLLTWWFLACDLAVYLFPQLFDLFSRLICHLGAFHVVRSFLCLFCLLVSYILYPFLALTTVAPAYTICLQLFKCCRHLHLVWV